jgi:hypothetical protein
LSGVLILGALEEEVLHLIGYIIDLHLKVLLLHLQNLPLIFEFTHLLLLFKDVDLFLLQELIKSLCRLFVVDLLLLQLPQRIGLLRLKLLLQTLDILLILGQLLFVVLLPHLKSVQARLLGLV